MGDLKRLLIVDDEETLTFTLYQVFIKASFDCEVVTASSGEEAVKKIEEGAFDLVITDIAMPGMNGLDLLSFVKTKYPQTRVIIITAYGTDEREELAYRIGADKYLEKPFDIPQLRDIVFKMIE